MLAIFLGTAWADSRFTEKRLSQVGANAELNRFIVRLARGMPLKWAVRVGIGLPTAGIAALGVFVMPWLLSFVAGMRTTLWLFQQVQQDFDASGASKARE